jgi:hypothetical protein
MMIEATPADQAARSTGTDTMTLIMVCLLAVVGLAGLVSMTG